MYKKNQKLFIIVEENFGWDFGVFGSIDDALKEAQSEGILNPKILEVQINKVLKQKLTYEEIDE